jgi:hypothetical protein
VTIELATVTLYARLALCAGVGNPLPLPTVTFHDAPYVRCGRASPNGTCNGVYRAKRRRIDVALGGIQGTTAHELLHDVLCQAGRNDPQHREPEWTTCLPMLAQ